MGFYKTDWFDVIGTNVEKQAISAGNTYSSEISCNGVYAYVSVSVKVVVDFGATPDGDVLINIYGIDESSGGADESDTAPIWTQRIKRSASTKMIITIPNISVMSMDALKIDAKNDDTIDPIYVWMSAVGAYNA